MLLVNQSRFPASLATEGGGFFLPHDFTSLTQISLHSHYHKSVEINNRVCVFVPHVVYFVGKLPLNMVSRGSAPPILLGVQRSCVRIGGTKLAVDESSRFAFQATGGRLWRFRVSFIASVIRLCMVT